MKPGMPGLTSPSALFSSSQPVARSLDLPATAALAYLGIPLSLFIVGWMRPMVSASLICLMVAGLWSARGLVTPRELFRLAGSTWHTLSLVLAVALFWASFGGGSHFVYANPDWLVRDAVLADLTATAWPPSYGTTDGKELILRSAIGFFLPPAVVGKFFGPDMLPFAMFFWTSAGIAVFFLLLPLPGDSLRLLGALAMIVLFSGMDVLGYLLLHAQYPIFPLRLEWWSEFQYSTMFSYSSLSGQLIWAPNHALPMWIATAFLVRYWSSLWLPAAAAILVPALLIATPFALPGLFPFLCLWLFDHRDRAATFSRPSPALILFGTFATVIIARLLTLDIGGISVAPAATQIAGGQSGSPWVFIKNYGAFVLLEFLLLTLVLRKLYHGWPRLLIVATGVLLALPFLALGPSNDLLLRVSTPSLVVLALITMNGLFVASERSRLSAWHGATALMLVIGAHTAVNELWRAVTWPRWAPDYTTTLPDTQNGGFPPHYIGRLDGSFLPGLLRPPQRVTGGAERFGKRPTQPALRRPTE